jgi:Rps23 Pro-64 3,4-dihydroxylase Tpa1-like proline 4-hydroxylase
MSTEQPKAIDLLAHDKKRRRAVMFISDRLDWEPDEGGHLELLQDKLNHYIWAIEHGKIVAVPSTPATPKR